MGRGTTGWVAVFSLGCFWGVLHSPIVQMYPLISVSEAAAPPIRMMACMQSQSVLIIIITKQLYKCKYTAMACSTIVGIVRTIEFYYETI